ncbi:MAG: VOC family protein [Anaerolineales bacterium]|nr:VOC family protein [Anaerolineales bacterium]HUV27769.1 VOC family protein [Anaerolineales bacterium]
MEPRISIITLGVQDLERSVHFYQDGLGLPLQKGYEGQIAFFELSGTWLALYPREALAADANQHGEGEGFQGFTLAHNVKTGENVDILIQQAASAGGQIVKEPQKADWGGYSGYFKDPDGFLWEIAWNPYFEIE